ncbi:MAG: hypothetical protein KDA84_22375, partial [Planctomycetaceae bacterium]|nr:hypothetical protein [Planctomycetaceae bacterium]
YVGECWPWTNVDEQKERTAIEEMVQKQKKQTAELVNYLQDAEWLIDHGTYPTEYTDLHYVALDFLLAQLIQNQVALVDDAKKVLTVCDADPAAKQLVGEIQAVQQTIASDLQSLVESRRSESTKTT